MRYARHAGDSHQASRGVRGPSPEIFAYHATRMVRSQQEALSAILAAVGVSPAEYTVMWHVRDTVVQPRDVIAGWAADNVPADVAGDIAFEDCLHATDSLIRRGLLIELTAPDIEADLARWLGELLPVSWGVDRDRRPGDIDLTAAGFELIEAIVRQKFPDLKRAPVEGYDDTSPGVIRVFGETEECCRRAVEHIVGRIHDDPWRWARDSVRIDAMRPLGPWWHSRFQRIPAGFEIVVRRA